MLTSPARVRVKPKAYEDAAIVLAGLGLIVFLFTPIYMALALTLVALLTLTVPAWARHEARTRWSRVAFALVVVGLVVQVGYLLTAPIHQ
jgi:hypothetical protein